MIERYTTKEMARLWSKENRLSVMLDVELAVCRAWCGLGQKRTSHRQYGIMFK